MITIFILFGAYNMDGKTNVIPPAIFYDPIKCQERKQALDDGSKTLSNKAFECRAYKVKK